VAGVLPAEDGLELGQGGYFTILLLSLIDVELVVASDHLFPQFLFLLDVLDSMLVLPALVI